MAPPHRKVFLTWNLKDSIPARIREEIQSERERLENLPFKDNETLSERTLRHHRVLFAMADRYLNSGPKGPLHLRHPTAAGIVREAILHGIPERYDLYVFTVMPNHVHLLIFPKWMLEKVTQGIKGFTSYAINKLQAQAGRTFWQDESYDHWVRDETEFHRTIHYIEQNPVKAGLCKKANEWRWSSAHLRTKYDWPAGQAFPPGVIDCQAGKPDLQK